jgi:hypothetical protein
MTPETIAHYRITALIGSGGMGEVYRARDTKLGRDVAIKILPAAFASDPNRMARFEREARVLASLNHPNIAHIYGVEDRPCGLKLVDKKSFVASSSFLPQIALWGCTHPAARHRPPQSGGNLMKFLTQLSTVALSVGIFAGLSVPNAYAGCGDTTALRGPFEFQQLQLDTRYAASAELLEQQAQSAGVQASIVGMWSVQLLAKGNSTHNPPIQDGAVLDFGYTQWHIDGTEITNSVVRAPATGDFCLGTWRRTGPNTYQLTHFASNYDAVGNLNGKVIVQEQVTVSPAGTKYTGTFTIDVYDPKTGTKVDHVVGDITATRLTVDSTTP